MAEFEIKMQHDEDTLEAMAHMQYDLFCKSNRIVRSLMSVGLILLGVVNHEAWWGILVIAYGCYLTTSTYASANHTAHKLAAQIKESGMPFPASRFVFKNEAMHIISLPEEKELNEPLLYKNVYRMGQDFKYFYIFRDQYGGYMIPREQLGDSQYDFRDFMEKKTGQVFQVRRSPFLKLRAWLRKRENEPYHL